MTLIPESPPPAEPIPAPGARDVLLHDLAAPAGSDLLDLLTRLQSAGPETDAAEKSAMTGALRDALTKQVGSGEKTDLSDVLKEVLAALAAGQLGLEEPEKKPKKKAKAKAKAKPKAEAKAKAKTKAKAKPKAEAKAKPKAKPKAEAKAKPKSKPKTATKPKAKAKAKAKRKATKAVELA